MSFKLEPYSLQVSSQSNFTTIHNSNNQVDVYSVTSGKCNKRSGQLELANWGGLSLGSDSEVFYDEDVSLLHSDIIEDLLTVLVWKDGTSHRIAVTPDDHPIYDPKAVNRLYWATDTRIMYQNIADTWQMVGTLKHNLLDDAGKYSHIEIDDKLDKLLGEMDGFNSSKFDISEW